MLGLAAIGTALWWKKKKDDLLMFTAQHGWQSLYNFCRRLGAQINPHSHRAQEALRTAILNRNDHMVRDLLIHGVNTNSIYEQGFTALMIAAQQGAYNIVILLLDNGSDVNMVNEAGQSAILLDIDEEILKLLIAHGAALRGHTSNGQTILHVAVNEHPHLTQLLVEHGADVNARNNLGQTPLMLACRRNLLDIARYLIDNGADISLQDSENHTALTYAQENIYHGYAAGLNSQLQELVQPQDARAMLREAIMHHNEHEVQQMVNNPQALLDTPYENEDTTALMLAARHGTFPIFKHIFCSCMEYDFKNKNGQNVLLLPITDEQIFEFLVKNLPFVDSHDNQGTTVLMNAIRLHGNNQTIIDSIMEKDVTVNAQDKEGKTALMLATELNNDQLVEKLIRHGARKDLTNQHNHTAYYFAQQAENRFSFFDRSGGRARNRHIKELLSAE